MPPQNPPAPVSGAPDQTPPLPRPPRPKKWPYIVGALILLLLVFIGLSALSRHPRTSPDVNIQSTAGATSSPSTGAPQFGSPEKVTIQGYSGSAEEPFITPDGQYLLFDNRTDPLKTPQVKIFYAKKVDALTFTFVGEVKGVDTGNIQIEPRMDDNGTFYFTSPRELTAPDYSGAYRGVWHDGTVTNIEKLPSLGSRQKGVFTELNNVSYDGATAYLQTLILSDSPHSIIQIAVKNPDGSFTQPLPASDPRAAAFTQAFASFYNGLPSKVIAGPPTLSRDGLEAFYGRDNFNDRSGHLYVAQRASTSDAFGTPEIVSAAEGFVERPFISPDGTRLYYHKALGDGTFGIYTLTL